MDRSMKRIAKAAGRPFREELSRSGLGRWRGLGPKGRRGLSNPSRAREWEAQGEGGQEVEVMPAVKQASDSRSPWAEGRSPWV